ncbi:NAD(P)H-hydrate dehydratase [Methanimicrococcus hongohii]|nr:NAD(P)H-hydrate dehydratase [Methanimicrococcus sp. Hf6]
MRQEVITYEELKVIEKNAIGLGMSSLMLMENAGAGVAASIECLNKLKTNRKNNHKNKKNNKTGADSNHDVFNSPVLILAGLGNNGGDAFVTARHLEKKVVSSFVFLLGTEDQIKTHESQVNFKLLKHSEKVHIFEIKSESELVNVYDSLKDAGIGAIIDGIFGTGFSGELKGLEKAAIELINSERKTRNIPVLSIDIPSGMRPDQIPGLTVLPIVSSAGSSMSLSDLSPDFLSDLSSNLSQELSPLLSSAISSVSSFNPESVVKADLTVTFHKSRDCPNLKILDDIFGEIVIAPIGIPEAAEKYVGSGDISSLYKRSVNSKKGDSGKVLVIAGGPFSGAPALSGMAAFGTGVDIVTIAAPESIYESISSYAPELIIKKLSGEFFNEQNIPFVTRLIQSHDAVVIGPGFGKNKESIQAAAKLVPYFKKAVIDADALVPEMFEAIEQSENDYADYIITPHYHELMRAAAYCGIDLSENRDEEDIFALEDILMDISERLGAMVLLKGQEDMIASFDEVRYNSTGNAAMSVGGTGDVLAGIVGGLLAKNKAELATLCGAYICGKAGDAAYTEVGDSLIPTDVIDKIPFAFSNGTVKGRSRKE